MSSIQNDFFHCAGSMGEVHESISILAGAIKYDYPFISIAHCREQLDLTK